MVEISQRLLERIQCSWKLKKWFSVCVPVENLEISREINERKKNGKYVQEWFRDDTNEKKLGDIIK